MNPPEDCPLEEAPLEDCPLEEPEEEDELDTQTTEVALTPSHLVLEELQQEIIILLVPAHWIVPEGTIEVEQG